MRWLLDAFTRAGGLGGFASRLTWLDDSSGGGTLGWAVGSAILLVLELFGSGWWRGRGRPGRHRRRDRALDDQLGIAERRRTLRLARREPRELHQIGLAQEALDLVQNGNARRRCPQFAEHFAGGALETVEAVAIAQVAPHDVRDTVEMLGEATLARQPGVSQIVQRFERD